jgi:hypothetical protein
MVNPFIQRINDFPNGISRTANYSSHAMDVLYSGFYKLSQIKIIESYDIEPDLNKGGSNFIEEGALFILYRDDMDYMMADVYELYDRGYNRIFSDKITCLSKFYLRKMFGVIRTDK